jgi:transcriptional regulator with XRE-family HTH domain
MKVTNVYSDRHRTAAQKAKEKEVRQRFQHWKPGAEELLASGQWPGLVVVEGQEEFWKAIRQVRADREAQGLTLKQVSERCGIDVATLSKLENGKQPNPTLFTMLLYVGAVGQRLRFEVGPRPRRAVQVVEVRDAPGGRDGNGRSAARRAGARRKPKAGAKRDE